MRKLRISRGSAPVARGHPDDRASQTSDGHVMATLPEAKWGPAPPMLPPGAEIAVLSGNPMGNSLYTMRVKFPAGYVIPAHSHPTDENVAVVSGTLFMGMGDKLNKAAGHGVGCWRFCQDAGQCEPLRVCEGDDDHPAVRSGPRGVQVREPC